MKLKMLALAAAVTMSLPAWADKTYNADVVVVGAGAGGTVAAVSAVEGGLKTIMIEKNAFPGGAGLFMEGSFGVQTPYTKAKGMKWTATDAFNAMAEYHHWRINAPLVKAFVELSGDTIQWVEDHGVKWKEVKTAWRDKAEQTWHIYPYAGSLPKTMVELFKKEGGTLLLNTPGEKLITKDGKVTGVIAKDTKTGEKVTINAKNVILATGGYSFNTKMVKDLTGIDMTPVGTPGRTGDGINMARLVGAHVAGMHAVAGNAPYLPDVPPINQFSGPDELKQGRCALAQPWLWVDHTGRRFFNESRGSVFVDVYNAMTTAGGVSYTIFDQEKMDRMIQKGAVLPFNAIVLAETPLKALPKTWEIGQQRGWAFKADTIEELAMQIGVPPKNLRETMQKVNSYAETGVDPEFGRKKEHLVKFNLEKGPYYALKAIRAFFLTLGGVTVTPNFEAKNPQGDVIRNLYVVGQDIGGLYDSSYDLRCEGSASSFAMTSGRVAALHALKAIEAGE